MSRTKRVIALDRLRAKIDSGRPIIAASAGSGLAAAAAEAGGADLLVVYNSGRFRAAGQGSLAGVLPFADANAVVRELSREVLAKANNVPVIAGVCAQHPFYDLDCLIAELAELGIAGVQNFPTIGLYGSGFVEDLEATGISFESEVELMRAARRAGLLTCAFVWDDVSAVRMSLAGVDVLAPHIGVTRAPSSEGGLPAAAAQIEQIAAAGRSVRDDLIVVFHGGPAARPHEVARVLELADGLHGFIGASSFERYPVERAIADAVSELVQAGNDAVVGASTAPDFDTPPPEIPLELTEATLPEYLRQRGLVSDGEELRVEELVGGVSNVVLRWEAGDKAGIVKQSRPQLRVPTEWLADVRRILNERDAIELLSKRVRPGSVPTLTFDDAEGLAIGMAPAPDKAILWKPELLSGTLDRERARQAGELLRSIHEATLDDPFVARRFTAGELLRQNRLDPWFRFAAGAHPDLELAFDYAIERLVDVRRVLVHGDYVPKNMFLLDDGLLLLDYEVVHFGNPGYDVATFVNHMLLKGFARPQNRLRLRRARRRLLDHVRRRPGAQADRARRARSSDPARGADADPR